MFLLLIAMFFSGCEDHTLDSRGEPYPVFQPVELPDLIGAIPTPEGFERTTTDAFGKWLQSVPLKDADHVMLHNGNYKGRQDVHAYILDIDVGKKDLQQCADAVMRLRGEYLFENDQADDIAFNYTNGDRIPFSKWKEGKRPVVKGNKVGWQDCSSCDQSYESFRSYMNNIFMFAGTASLSKELKSKPLNQLAAGDVFIQGGYPGHAIIVVDVAENSQGRKIFMLAQSYMPAQDIHILKNYNTPELSPWYAVDQIVQNLETPEWTFSKDDLKEWE